MSHLGNMVRLYRVAHKIEQQVLTTHIGLTPGQLSRLENGRSTLDADQLVKVMAWLLSDPTPPPAAPAVAALAPPAERIAEVIE
jgi:transcriptional regulator with XRE-family HTH domain